MTKQNQKKHNNTLVKNIEKKYGVSLGYHSDAQLHSSLKKRGIPSLSKLLKLTGPKKLK